MKPKVFISHSSQDKERFVNDFANRLKEKGIDVWLDQWKMLPGDSLIDKIFNEGIADADAFIVIISENSVNSKWVKEELNLGLINRLQKQTKVIPILIDSVEPPEVLKTILWEKLDKVNDYNKAFNRIINSIYENREISTQGTPPKYASNETSVFEFDDLKMTENIILGLSCDLALESNSSFITTESLIDLAEKIDLDRSIVLDTLDYFDEMSYIDSEKMISGIFAFKVNLSILIKYLEYKDPNFDSNIEKIVYSIINEDVKLNTKLSELHDLPIPYINIVLEYLSYNDFIEIFKVMGGDIFIHRISQQLKRLLR